MKKLDGLTHKLKNMREAARRVSRRILKKRSDAIAIYIMGSAARGNIHEKSDVDLVVLVERGDFEEEKVEELSCVVDVAYVSLKRWREELRESVGSDWEWEASCIADAIVLYDPKGVVTEVKEKLRVYPEGRRKPHIKIFLGKLRNFSEAVQYHYINENYDIESLFGKLYAMEAVRILFPINRVYLMADKYMFRQLEQLKQKPPNYLDKCLDLLWSKSKNVNPNEAKRIVDTVSESKKAIENMINKMGFLKE